jgi:hypothetical protein
MRTFMSGLQSIYSGEEILSVEGQNNACSDQPSDSECKITNTATKFYRVSEIYRFDRFLDSLIFVYLVNHPRLSLYVSAMPYAFNYMPFFEAETMEMKELEAMRAKVM